MFATHEDAKLIDHAVLQNWRPLRCTHQQSGTALNYARGVLVVRMRRRSSRGPGRDPIPDSAPVLELGPGVRVRAQAWVNDQDAIQDRDTVQYRDSRR